MMNRVKSGIQRWAVRRGFLLASVRIDGSEISAMLQSLRPMTVKEKLIRVGPEKDGGYVVPETIFEVDGLISPGVGLSCDFDQSVANHGVPVLMIDHTLAAPPVNNNRFQFLKMELSSFDSETEISLESAVSAMGGERNLALQMDIEGAEWTVLSSARESTLESFKVMVIEFHNFHKLATSPTAFSVAQNVFRKLRRSHGVAHAHVNNCCEGYWFSAGNNSLPVYAPSTFELTLLRRDSFHFKGAPARAESELDYKNLSNKQEPVLPREWLD